MIFFVAIYIIGFTIPFYCNILKRIFILKLQTKGEVLRSSHFKINFKFIDNLKQIISSLNIFI